MPEPICPRDEYWEGADPAWTLAQIPRKDGLALTLTDVTDVSLSVWDIQTKTEIYTAVIAPASVISAVTLTSYWREDTIGFNFSHYLNASDVFGVEPDQDGKVYRLEYSLVCNDGSGTIPVVREIVCRARFSA